MALRMVRSARRVPAIAALAAALLASAGCVHNGPVASEAAAAEALPISEGAFIPIGGIEQWITIKGADRRNPIVLVVHGGPGNPLSPVADGLFGDWEQDFTIVQWDQRGAGRTYSRNGPPVAESMNVERMAQDGVEVAEYITAHLGQDKVIIFATSWGSVLGVHMVKARPDLFRAYVGHSQFVAWDANLGAAYDALLQRAEAAGDAGTLAELGPPPWPHISYWPRFRRVYALYQEAAATAAPVEFELSEDYASDEEQALYSEAEDFSFEHLWGLTLSGPLTKVDLPALGPAFGMPVHIVQGEQDLWTVPELAREYFDSIEAPDKQFHLVEGAGHAFSQSGMEQIHAILQSEAQ